ncbi:MAG TPA: hypothetical protein VG477_18450 [Thermoanaerobaculia bacterium]|nr:hypothetical protein [Thermoanaerobaculia bacterium]
MSARVFLLSLLVALSTACAYAQAPAARCPASGKPLPTPEQRQYIVPAKLLTCFLTRAEIAAVRGSIGHSAQTTVTDPAFESGELNPDGSLRPPLTAEQTAALAKMHAVLDDDMRESAVIRKFIPNSDVGGFLYGRTVIGSPDAPIVVNTNTVRGFVGLERNTQGLDAGEAIAALGLDYETTATGQFTDDSPLPFRRQVSQEVRQHGLHSIRHHMSAQGAIDAKIPLARDLNDYVQANDPTLDDRSFEMNRQGQDNPYTGLGMSDDIGLLTLDETDGEDAIYPLHINEEDVMTVPTPLARGDVLLRRSLDVTETLIARYVRATRPDGTVANVWYLSPRLSAADRAYYRALVRQAAARVAAAGG